MRKLQVNNLKSKISSTLRLALLWFGVTLFFLFLALPVKALGEFKTAYDVTYTVAETGNTQVSYEITLTNLTDKFYVTEYTLVIGSTKIKNIKAFDNLGPLVTQILRGEKLTQIRLFFNEKVAGLGSSLKWKLSYESGDIATKNGLVWEIRTPKMAEGVEISDYKVTLSVPLSFRDPAFMTPAPKERIVRENRQVYIFEGKPLSQQGISATFGRFQVFQFELAYHLKNPNLFPIETSLALPPDTVYQTIILTQLEPEPEDVVIDEDGNWLASYRLAAGEKLLVEAAGFAKIYPRPKVSSVPKLSAKQKLEYTKPQKFWEAESSLIKDRALKLKTPEKIYQFVVSTLKYDPKRLEGSTRRLGAETALKNPGSAVCMEFTDLFIALARAAGIPARELNGYAYTANELERPLSLKREGGDVLHSWAEYFDPTRGWVPVDPTWGATSGVDFFNRFDLSHLVFVTHGVSSEKPYPAGAYREAKPQKNVRVDFAPTVPETILEPEVVFNFPDSVVSGLSFSGEIVLTNKGNIAYYPTTLKIESGFFENRGQAEFEIGPLPPFSKRRFQLVLKSPKVVRGRVETLVVKYDDQPFTENILVKPFLVFSTKTATLILGGIASAVLLFFFTQELRRLFIFRR